MKKLLSLLMAFVLVFSLATVASAEENDEAVVLRAPACVCGGAYVVKSQYWDFDNPINMRNCIYGISAVSKDWMYMKYETISCDRCGDVYSRNMIDIMWYCPDKNLFYND